MNISIFILNHVAPDYIRILYLSGKYFTWFFSPDQIQSYSVFSQMLVENYFAGSMNSPSCGK
jgi:hypothetical protein